MQPVPEDLLALVKKAAPPEAEIVPLAWAFEDEDYNIAVVMPDVIDRLIHTAGDLASFSSWQMALV